jgi:soluble lytic murein transglycosylase-like protein
MQSVRLGLSLVLLISPLASQDVVNNVMQWQPEVEELCPDLDTALVLGIIAQESRGEPYVVRDEGKYESVGLMQIMTFDWRPSRGWLMIPENNIQWGCSILRQLFARENYTTEKVLAVYNCGEVRVEANRCGSNGGYAYADTVLQDWVPLFRLELLIQRLQKRYHPMWMVLFRIANIQRSMI